MRRKIINLGRFKLPILVALLFVVATSPPAAAQGGCTSTHRVRAGDTLTRIARSCDTTVNALQAANGLSGDLIFVGQVLQIPGGSANSSTAASPSTCTSPITVRAGDTLTRIALRCGTTVQALQTANGIKGDLIYVGQQLLLPGSVTQASPESAAQLPKVVIVVVDGWRYEDTYGDATHRNIPRIWNDLRPLGTWHARFYNFGLTTTAPGHAAILGGVWQPIPNDGSGRPTHPTLFEYFRQQTGAPAEDTALVFTGTLAGKAAHWAYSTAAGYGPELGALPYNIVGADFDDLAVLDVARAALVQHPRLVMIAFPAVDEWAHTGNFDAYLRAIRTVDGAIWQLWNALQADPFYAAQTTLFVTNDHGRRLDDFTTHGDMSESEQHVTLLTLGPRTPAGVTVSSLHTLRDIAPTVGQLMGFSTSLAEGDVMWDLISQ